MSDYKKVIINAEKLNKDFEELKPKIEKMLFYLEDDPATNSKGLISRLTSVEKQLADMLTESKIDKGKKSTYFFIGGVVIWIITNFEKVLSFFGSVNIKQ